MSCQHQGECDHGDVESGMSLYSQVDTSSVRCFNALDEDMAKKIFKPFEDRHDTTQILTSESDEQMILIVPFISMVTLKSISLLGLGDDTSPAEIELFVNRPDLDFSSIDDATPAQILTIPRETSTNFIPEFPLKPVNFAGVSSLTLFIKANYGNDVTSVSYMSFKGLWTAMTKDLVPVYYELAANPADHRIFADTLTNARHI